MMSNFVDDYELPDEVDFSKMKRIPNPFVQNFRELNPVSLEADVKAMFPDSEAVNAALRGLMEERTRESAGEDAGGGLVWSHGCEVGARSVQ